MGKLVKDSLGDRMKRYEDVNRNFLTKRVPVVIRVDGKSFSSFTSKYIGKIGFNKGFHGLMVYTAKKMCEKIQGCNLAYIQSDEISFLLTDYKTIKTSAWFDYNINKLCSVSASMATYYFLKIWCEEYNGYTFPSGEVCFDSRAFNVPKDDVCNYFIWRQKDATKNAISTATREYYSHKEIHGKNSSEMQEMLFQKGINFNDYEIPRKRGTCIYNGVIDKKIPIFTQDREYIEKLVYVRED